jgi:hypothetical protein
MLAALRRLGLLLVGTAIGVGGAAALIGLAAGSSIERAVSVAFYLVGAFLIVLGFFAGNRGPLRPRATGEGEPIAGMFGIGVSMRGARTASGDERQDALATAAIFLGVGIWLILLGVVADASVRVV